MNTADIDLKITFYTNADTNNYLPADRLIDINSALDDTHIMILQSADGADFDDKNYTSDFPESTTNLEANQADYSIPTDLIKEKRLTISYDGTNWYKARPFDINESNIALKDSFFTEANPYYDLHDNSIQIYPTPKADVTAGLKIWMSRNMELFTSDDMTTGTKEPGFDRQFHKIIPLKVAYDWVLAKTPNDANKLTGLGNKIMEYEQRLKQHYSDKQRDNNMTIKPAYSDYDTGRSQY